MPNTYYIYVHRTADTNSIFYIGKGTKGRAWQTHNRSKFWKSLVEKHGYTAELVAFSEDEEDMYRLEKELIEFYGKRYNNTGCLVNVNEGGRGVPRFTQKPGTIEKFREQWTGLKNPKADLNVYKFKHIHTQEEFEGTRVELETKYGVSVADLFSNTSIANVNGWKLADSTLKGKADENIYTFIHKDGSTFTGTRIAFKEHTGVNAKPLFAKLTKQLYCKGWKLLST